MFKIFSHVGEIIGRNSPQAIEADLILFLERNRESLNYDPINRNPIVHLEYIEQSIPDSDMKSKVWFMRIYRQVMRPFYQVL